MCAVSLLCLSCMLEETELADICQTVSTSLWLQLRQRERFKISKKGLKPKHPLAGGDIMWMPVLCLSRLHGRSWDAPRHLNV